MVGSVVAPDTIGRRAVFAHAAALVTLETPAHRQRHLLLHAVHALDRTVTPLTRHRCAHVAAVIEMHEVGEVVHLHPRDWALLQHRLAQFLDLCGLPAEKSMAIHADAGRGNAGMRTARSRVMAVEAWDVRVT